jgi:catechol 2,3-dioxygenase-like lactoylglutathione lyase family enzyme
MTVSLAAVTFLVRDYDEAISWFVDCLGFELIEDTVLGDGKRWVRVAAPGGSTSLLLAKAVGSNQLAAVGQAAGGRVAYFLNTADLDATFARMTGSGVRFRETPRTESYGKVAVFEDLYGNGWDLIEPAQNGPNR